MTQKILLGKYQNETIYLTKHNWDCDWYWGFGYVGNSRNHFHIDSMIVGANEPGLLASELFDSTWITDKQWWIVRDMFVQAYALKSAAEVYRYGGHQSILKGVTDILRMEGMSSADAMIKQLNDDLKLVLDTIWNYLLECKSQFDKDKVKD